MSTPYEKAQLALANLKDTIFELLQEYSKDGLSNVEIGRVLGIYSGNVGHEGHIYRTLLELKKADGVINLDKSKSWYLLLMND